MTVCFMRALQRLPSLHATVASIAANVSLTGLAGAVVFSEPIGMQWICGASLMLLGVVLVSAGRVPGHAAANPAGKEDTHTD